MPKTGLMLQPLDVLLFRQPRPFAAADTAITEFPTPQSLFGLIRTRALELSGASPVEVHGAHHGPPESWPWHARLRVRGPWLWYSGGSSSEEGHAPPAIGPLVPAPLDLVSPKSDPEKLERLRPLENPPPGWSAPEPENSLAPLWYGGEGQVTRAAGWLDVEGLKAYLKGGVPKRLIRDAQLWGHERRTGIGIEKDRRTTKRGLIYSSSLLRLKPGFAFYAELDYDGEGAPPPEALFPAGCARSWGGESRRVAVECCNPFNWESVSPPADSPCVTSLLTTPAVFGSAHGWRPVQPRGRLRGAAVPPPQPVSGWQLTGKSLSRSEGRPRPTRFAVPAGAVYLWQANGNGEEAGDSAPSAMHQLVNQPQLRDAGWGLALRGCWQYADFS